MRYLAVLYLFMGSCSVTGQDSIQVFTEKDEIKTIYHSIDQVYLTIHKEEIKWNDSIDTSKFRNYVNTILTMPIDSIQELDTLTKYSVKYLSECSFDVIFKNWNYLDSDHRICIHNISESTDTMTLDFIDLRFEGKPYSSNLDKYGSMFFYYLTVDKSEEPFKPEIFNILSFNKGKYLIIHTRITAPDTRGSLPPGVDLTLFLERAE